MTSAPMWSQQYLPTATHHRWVRRSLTSHRSKTAPSLGVDPDAHILTDRVCVGKRRLMLDSHRLKGHRRLNSVVLWTPRVA